MRWQLVEPEQFLEYQDVPVYHAYKDEFSDIPLEYWYSTSSSAMPGSDCEFDVRDLPGYYPPTGLTKAEHDEFVIKSAIEAGLINSDCPVFTKSDA